jgi:hypothetical protein
MSDRAAYSRVYWSVMDDPKFDGIREDVRHFGSWSILLIVADMAWPAPAYVPSLIPRASYRALVAAELVDDLSGGRFRIHGLEAERARRREAATRPPTGRTPRGPQPGPNRDPNGAQDEDETRRDEVRRDEPTARDGLPSLDRAAIEALEERTGQIWSQAGEKQLGEYDRLVGQHGLPAVLSAFDAIRSGKRLTARQLIWPALRLLEPFPTPTLVKSEGNDEAERTRRNVERTKRHLHDIGHHQETPDPGCPACQAAAS